MPCVSLQSHGPRTNHRPLRATLRCESGSFSRSTAALPCSHFCAVPPPSSPSSMSTWRSRCRIRTPCHILALGGLLLGWGPIVGSHIRVRPSGHPSVSCRVAPMAARSAPLPSIVRAHAVSHIWKKANARLGDGPNGPKKGKRPFCPQCSKIAADMLVAQSLLWPPKLAEI